MAGDSGNISSDSPVSIFFFVFASLSTLSSITVCLLIYLQKQTIISSTSTCCRLLFMLHMTLVIEEITSLPFAYNTNKEVCEIMGFLHAYSGLANIVAMWLLTLYYANYVYVSKNWIQRFIQNQRYTRLMVFVFPLITVLPLIVHYGEVLNDKSNDDDETSYGRDHDIFCAFEAKSHVATIWVIMVYYIWAWLFIFLSLGIVIYVIFTVQKRYVVFCRCHERTMSCCLRIRSLLRGEGMNRVEFTDEDFDEDQHILLGDGSLSQSFLRGNSMSYTASTSRMSGVSIGRTRDKQLVSKIFSTVGIYVMITLGSWIPRTFRRFRYFVTSGTHDYSTRNYLLLTLPIYFIGICYAVLFLMDSSPLQLQDVNFGNGSRRSSTGDHSSSGGVDIEWDDILNAADIDPVESDPHEDSK